MRRWQTLIDTPSPRDAGRARRARPHAGRGDRGGARSGRRPAATAGSRRCSRAVNADAEVRAWWHMAQVHSERLGMSDHSWVHVQVVLNIALRLLRLLVKGGVEPAMVTDHGMRDRDAEVVVAGGRAAARRRHVDPPRRPRGLQPLPRRAQAARAARRRLPGAAERDGGDRRVPARDHRPPPPRRAVHARGRRRPGRRRARHGPGPLAAAGRGRPDGHPRDLGRGDRRGRDRGRRGARRCGSRSR